MKNISPAEKLLNEVTEAFDDGGIDESRMEACMIVEDALNCDYTRIRAGLSPTPTTEQVRRVFRMMEMRLSGAPVAHVLGYTTFYGYRFHVYPGVLVPRRETELLIDTALEILDLNEWEYPCVLDLYAGCGNVLLSIYRERTIAHGLGVDIDPAACECAADNRHEMDCANTLCIKRDVTSELENLARRGRKFHLVTANPPYVLTRDIPNLQLEIFEHENHASLDGGADGLDHYRMLAEKLPMVIIPGGYFITEIGIEQDDPIGEIFSGWDIIDIRPDLNGIPRVLTAKP